MADIAQLTADLEALKELRRTGALRIRINEREVVFRSDAELVAAIAAIEEELSPRPRAVVIRSSKGWE
jgi:hypothetical protein